MKVYGQLEVAQLENLGSDPTPAPRARAYFNTATLKPKIYDGTAWKTLAYESAASSIYNAGNGGKAITVNWDNGVTQRVTLTDHCLISFSGTPVDGTMYTLIVENTTTVTYGFLFDLLQDTQGGRVQPTWLQYGDTRVVRFLYRTTAGTAGTTITAPGAGPNQTISAGSGTGRGIDVWELTEGESRLLVATTGGVNNVNSWGYKTFYDSVSYSSRSLYAPSANDHIAIKVSPSGKLYAGVTTTGTPFSYIGLMTSTGEPTTTLFSAAATAPTGACQSGDWHPTEKAIAFAHTTSPFITAYPVTPAAFGTKYTNPGTLPAGNATAVAFSPFGDFVALLCVTTPFIHVYPFNLSTGFGAKATNPGTLPPGAPSAGGDRQVAWRPQGDWVLCGSATTPYLWQCPFNRATGAFGTPVAVTGSNLPTGEVRSIAFHPSGKWVVIGAVGGMYVYPFNATTGITNSSPMTISGGTPSGNTINAVFSGDGKTIFSLRSTTAIPENFTFPYLGANWYRVGDRIR